jgi:NAD(P)-dependent dehydrogenase (short-subunit alcohol dehydrogenase family)
MITGANRGLGLGLARAYLESGWAVIAVNRSQSPELENLGGDGLETHLLDLTDDAQLTALAETLEDRTIDVLIGNAGRMAKTGFAIGTESVQGFGHFDRALWHDVFDINVFTPMSMAELFINNLARSERGRIVTISSMLGSMGMNTVIDGLTMEDSGKFLSWDGTEMPW